MIRRAFHGSYISGLIKSSTSRVIVKPFFHHRLYTSSSQKPTIFALLSAPGKAAVSIVRVSGSLSAYILKSLTGTSRITPRKAVLRKLTRSGNVLDHALTIFFKGPKSFTGEDLLELHLHGGSATVKSVLSALSSLNDPKNGTHIRYAEPGEFTQRAFQNGRLDLTEAEGIRDLIEAETETQREAAISSMEGYNKRFFSEIRTRIVKNSAMLSAVIDFGDDHDLEMVDSLMDRVLRDVEDISQSLKEHTEKGEKTQLLMQGVKMVFIGPTNVGKSSLLNEIANKDAAIVSSLAGTTRDVMDLPIDIGGYKVVVSDTAGIRETDDLIEQEGIRRAKKRASDGDVVCVMVASNERLSDDFVSFARETVAPKKHVLLIINKTDLAEGTLDKQEYCELFGIASENTHLISCKTKKGVQTLVQSLQSIFEDVTEFGGPNQVSLTQRARDIIRNDILFELEEFKEAQEAGDIVMASEALNRAAFGIGKITGESVGVEEVLGVIFSTFCIGK